MAEKPITRFQYLRELLLPGWRPNPWCWDCGRLKRNAREWQLEKCLPCHEKGARESLIEQIVAHGGRCIEGRLLLDGHECSQDIETLQKIVDRARHPYDRMG